MIKKPCKLEKSYLDALSYTEIQEDIRREVIRNVYGREFDLESDAFQFCNEIENYLALRFPERDKKVFDEVCKTLNISEEKRASYLEWLITRRKNTEKEYKWIVL